MSISALLASAAAIAVLTLSAVWVWNASPTLTRIDESLPADFPDDGFSHATFEELLRRFVDGDGRIQYERWQADPSARAELDRYLAAVAAFSPEATPERFPSDADALAYWMYAYNAFVIKAVLDRWPLESVTDVRAPIEITKGFGFFYKLRFVAGEKEYSLYDLEKRRIREDGNDPRIHFVLSCASGSCPVVRPELPTGDALEPFLAEATTSFVTDPDNVAIDHDARTLTLSKIFEWYEDDFAAHLRAQGRPSDRGALDYIRTVAPAALAAELDRARGYDVRFRKYDWKVNASR